MMYGGESGSPRPVATVASYPSTIQNEPERELVTNRTLDSGARPDIPPQSHPFLAERMHVLEGVNRWEDFTPDILTVWDAPFGPPERWDLEIADRESVARSGPYDPLVHPQKPTKWRADVSCLAARWSIRHRRSRQARGARVRPRNRGSRERSR